MDPRTGVIYLKEQERGSIITIRPLGSPDKREISYGSWMTWERHRWPEETRP
jgi:hypothetical protein